MAQEIKKILPIIFLIAAAGLGWLSWQGYQDILAVQNQIKDSEDKILVLNLAAEKANKFVSFMKENPESSEKLNILLSDSANKPNLVYFLSSGAFSNGLLLKKINFEDSPAVAAGGPAAAVSADKPSAQNVKLVLSGTYSSLKNFLTFAEKSLKLIDVVSVDFKVDAEGKEKVQIQSYDFTVGLKTYYIPKNDNISKEAKILLANSLVDLSFTKGKQFTDLVSPQNYNVDTTDTGDWVNKNIF